MLESLLNKVACIQASYFIQKRIQHRWFPVNIAKFLLTAFFIEHLQWLFLITFNQDLLFSGGVKKGYLKSFLELTHFNKCSISIPPENVRKTKVVNTITAWVFRFPKGMIQKYW